MKVVEVIFSKSNLTKYDVISSAKKRYCFSTNEDILMIGDKIVSDDYDNPMYVTNVRNNDCEYTGYKVLKITTINGHTLEYVRNTRATVCCNITKPADPIKIDTVTVSNTTKSNTIMEKKSIFSNFIEKYKSQFVPEKDENLKLSMDGNVCVRIDNEYVGIDSENNLVSYPEEMCMDMPILVIAKPHSQVEVGDIIKMNNHYAKVLKKNANGSLSCLSYSGYTQNKKEVKDFMLGQAYVKVVVNMFSNLSNCGFNPMMFALMDGNMNAKDLMLLQMIQPNQKLGEINPMMLMLLADKNESNTMMETMLMMQMMGRLPGVNK